MILKWCDPNNKVLSLEDETGHIVIIEEGHPDWNTLSIKNNVEPYIKPLEEVLDHFRTLADNLVESTAKKKGYNSAAHLTSYVTSTVPAWSHEATVFIAWRDAVWLTVFNLLNTLSEVPTDDLFLSQIPAISWETQGVTGNG